ncbi:MAG: tRNA (guanosine(37)-N1)-methyltransferase TrmD [Candidatus Levyibacteriota bacterium]|nr:MAG: tRNA (guanosine(37)-N1)-methyltransferase TrmD [Candidatus Levybacteria bacterium]
MKISILTLFPEMFGGAFDHSIIKKAQEKKILSISYVNIRDFGIGKHRIVDDTPYGGGAGMVIRVDVIANALAHATRHTPHATRRILLDPQGEKFTQKKAQELSKYDHLILICGRYEGVDERVRKFVDEEISIGDYVLTGGEIPAMVITDAVCRLLPDVIKEESPKNESFSNHTLDAKRYTLLEYSQYTRPPIFNGKKVPIILTKGDHQKIAGWRNQEALKKTKKKRPDLLQLESGKLIQKR